MVGENKPSAELAAELKAGYEALNPQRSALQARVNELGAKITALREEAGSTEDGWRFVEEWGPVWMAYENLTVRDEMLTEEGISFEIDYEDLLVPFYALDEIDEMIADGKRKLAQIVSERIAQQGEGAAEERERLLARIAELDARIESNTEEK